MLGYEYHPEAEAEYLAEVDYYSRVSSELGLRFVKEVESAIARARQFPEAWAPLPGNLRRVHPRRFPHSVVYEVMAQSRVYLGGRTRQPPAGLWARAFGGVEIMTPDIGSYGQALGSRLPNL